MLRSFGIAFALGLTLAATPAFALAQGSPSPAAPATDSTKAALIREVLAQSHVVDLMMRQLLVFYHSPIGQKMLAEQPAIAIEAMDAGRAWGQQLGMEIGQQMAAEGHKAP